MLTIAGRWTAAVGAVVLLIIGGVAGYALGRGKSSNAFHIRFGRVAYVASGEGTASFGPRFSDGLGPEIPWVQDGTIHESWGFPCGFRPQHEYRVEMGTVRYPFAGGYSNAVVWIRC